MKKDWVLAGVLCLTSSQAFANKLSADVNPDTFHIQADAIHATNGILYAGELLLTTDDGGLVSLGLRTDGQVGNNVDLRGGLGGKIYGLDDEANTYAALSIGGHLEYSIPELKGIRLSGALYYAPSLTISDDVDSLIDFNLRVTYDLFENASVYGGYRHVESEYDFGAEHEFDSGPHVGIQIDF